MHGLISGLPADILKINKFGYLDWLEYSENFGYCSFANVYDNTGVSRYITKYIKKDIYNSNLELGKHLYYCSKGLKLADKIFEGSISSDIELKFDFENDFCKIKSFNSEDELQNYFKNSQFYEKI